MGTPDWLVKGGGGDRHGWGLVKKTCAARARRANTPPEGPNLGKHNTASRTLDIANSTSWVRVNMIDIHGQNYERPSVLRDTGYSGVPWMQEI